MSGKMQTRLADTYNNLLLILPSVFDITIPCSEIILIVDEIC